MDPHDLQEKSNVAAGGEAEIPGAPWSASQAKTELLERETVSKKIKQRWPEGMAQ